MKTIDEVIENFEKACDLERRCENCSGCLGQENGCPNDGAEYVPDALHYLKEYQKVDSNYWHEKAISELNNIADAYFLRAYRKEQHENVPLTWDELKLMEGKPVWFEGYAGNFWCIVREMQKNSDGTEDVIFDGPHGMTGVGHDDQYGDKWQAYRKERT